MPKWLSNWYYTFPIQLILFHLKRLILLLALWVILLLFISGGTMADYGMKYLFLTPEYLGNVDFYSFFIMGITFGGFSMTWNITTYILSTKFFPFLATLQRPFSKFSLNNSLIPLGFFIIYIICIINHQWYYEYLDAVTILYNVLGLITGFLSAILMTAMYFEFTNKDFSKFKPKRQPPPNITFSPGQRELKIDAISLQSNAWKVRSFINDSLRWRPVRTIEHYDRKTLLRVFRQNHSNAIVVQFTSILFLIATGLLIEYPLFLIPAGASAFIFFSTITSLLGFLIYWMQDWIYFFLLLLLILVNTVTKYDLVKHTNKAYGLQYSKGTIAYEQATLEAVFSQEAMNEDKKETLTILNNWKRKAQSSQYRKPKMVIVATSGGGSRAALWTMQVLREGDKATNGKLLEQTSLMTGASGGMIGAAYMREIMLRAKINDTLDMYDDRFIENISKDMLNPIAFTLASTDLFYPFSSFEKNGEYYLKDRGYMMERQLLENTEGWLDKSLLDYADAEKNADIPLLFLSPSIVNDGRRMIISSQKVAYMTRPPLGNLLQDYIEYDAIDYQRFFADFDAPQTRITSAIRANAAFPYILPRVALPTSPSIELMDAGYADNQGLSTSIRFIQVFKDWIIENTSGVVLVVINNEDKLTNQAETFRKGSVEDMFTPINLINKITYTQEFDHDQNLDLIHSILGKGKLDVVCFTYLPSESNERASMNFHLTYREKTDVLNAILLPQNQEALETLRKIVR